MRQEAMIHRMERTKVLARYYHQLQGWRQVPMGLLFLLLAAEGAGWWPWFSVWQPLSSALAFGLAFMGVWWFGRYYEQRFGRVSYRRSTKDRLLTLLAGVAWLAAFFVANWAEYTWQWPFSASILVWAFTYVLLFWRSGKLFFQYLVVAALLALVSLLPLTGLLAPEQVYLFGPEAVPTVALLGVIIILSGLLDHWWLVRSMQSLQEGES